jgi:hypothetical protein
MERFPQKTEFSNQDSESIIQEQINDILAYKAAGLLSPSDTLDYGKETLDRLLEEGYPIVFSVPYQFKNKVKNNGLTLHETDIPGFKALAGTIGIPPYTPEDEPRLLAILRPGLAKKYKIQPRFTGKDTIFQGVIITLNSIPASDLEFIDSAEIKKSVEVQSIQAKTKKSINLAS